MSTMSTPFPMDNFDTESDDSLVDDNDDQMTWPNEDRNRQRNNGTTNGEHIQIYKITELRRGRTNTARRTVNDRRERRNVDELRRNEMGVDMRKLWNYLHEVMRDRQQPEASVASDENASDDDENGVIQVEDLTPNSNFSNDEPEETEDPATNDDDADDENNATEVQERQSPPLRRRHENTDHDYDVLRKRVKRNENKPGRNEVFGKIVGMRMQDIKNETQKLLAEKMINETLFMAEMGKLSVSHSIGIFSNI